MNSTSLTPSAFKLALSTIYVPDSLLLSLMFLTLLIPSEISAIATWSELSPLILLRASVWLLGLSTLPGLYTVRLTGIGERLSRQARIAVALNLSLIFVGLATLIWYRFGGEIVLLPWLLLAVIIILGLTSWFKRVHTPSVRTLKLSRWNLLLIISIIANIFIALLVQVSQRYLIPGDVWVSLNPTVQMISQTNVYEAFLRWEYPVAFGFILTGLSVSSGLPVVNTYVLLFPLVAVNVLSFYTLVKHGFQQADKVATIASILYVFGGGLAWLAQAVLYRDPVFWQASFVTHDAYFAINFWNSIEFSHKSLALTLAYTSITMLVLSTRRKSVGRRLIALSISSFALLSSFFIHMLEVIVFVPIVLATAYIYQTGKARYLTLASFVVITIIVGYTIDLLMSGYYYWLTTRKVETTLLTTINTDTAVFGSVAGTALVIVTLLFLSKSPAVFRIRFPYANRLSIIKYVSVLIIVLFYFSGLLFWEPPSLELSLPFPWYSYVTRYGFLGLFALLGIALTNWKERWFMLLSSWSVSIVIIGSIWWGERLNSYLFPSIALLAALGICGFWRNTRNPPQTTTIAALSSGIRLLKLSPKHMSATLLIIVIGLSFTSVIYGASYYVLTGPSISDDEVNALSWVSENVPYDAAVLVPNIYGIAKGIETISDRQIYESISLPASMDAGSFTGLVNALDSHNVRYAVSIGGGGKASLAGLLLSHSSLVFRSGDVKVLRLPRLSPPSSTKYTVAVVYRESVGISGNLDDVRWVDDSFSDGWSYRNIEPETEGEVVTLSWEFHTGEKKEPSMKRYIPSIDTNTYPTFFIRYRNTPDTTSTAHQSIGQIITLLSEPGYPEGFVKNIYLPVSNETAFRIFIGRLPEDQKITQVHLWMRNYKELDGRIGLQIDYIGFASHEYDPDPQAETGFLSMALASLWPEDYSILSSFDQAPNALVVISTYDENVLDYIKDATNTHTFVFLNTTASFPYWGTGWTKVKAGVISGNVEGRNVIIVGVEAIYRAGITILAEEIYQEIKSSQ